MVNRNILLFSALAASASAFTPLSTVRVCADRIGYSLCAGGGVVLAVMPIVSERISRSKERTHYSIN